MLGNRSEQRKQQRGRLQAGRPAACPSLAAEPAQNGIFARRSLQRHHSPRHAQGCVFLRGEVAEVIVLVADYVALLRRVGGRHGSHFYRHAHLAQVFFVALEQAAEVGEILRVAVSDLAAHLLVNFVCRHRHSLGSQQHHELHHALQSALADSPAFAAHAVFTPLPRAWI